MFDFLVILGLIGLGVGGYDVYHRNRLLEKRANSCVAVTVGSFVLVILLDGQVSDWIPTMLKIIAAPLSGYVIISSGALLIRYANEYFATEQHEEEDLGPVASEVREDPPPYNANEDRLNDILKKNKDV